MTDLPRFHQGSMGKLGFEDLNEVMRRLDALRPLVESALLKQERPFEIRSLIFLVKAKRIEGSIGRFSWNEVLIDTDDKPKTEGDDGFDGISDSFDVSFRSGGQPSEDGEDEADDYAVLLDDSNNEFEEGLAICFAAKRVDKATRYVLVPLGESTPKPIVFKVSGGGGITGVSLGDSSVSAVRYTGNAFRYTTEGGWEEVEGEAELLDFSIHVLNEPSHNTGATFSYHALESGTIITPTFVSSTQAYLGTLPRLDFECK